MEERLGRGVAGIGGGADMKENPAALERWLYWATMDLAEESKARVRAEIKAHYWETVEGFLEEGRTEEYAHRLALRSLGDHHAAALSFNRAYVTKEDVVMISGLRGEPTNLGNDTSVSWGELMPLLLVTLVLAIPVVFALALNPPSFFTALRFGAFVVLGVAALVAWMWPWTLYRNRIFQKFPLRRALLLAAPLEAAFLAFTLVLLYGASIYWFGAGDLFFWVFFVGVQAIIEGALSWHRYRRLSMKVAPQEEDLRNANGPRPSS